MTRFAFACVIVSAIFASSCDSSEPSGQDAEMRQQAREMLRQAQEERARVERMQRCAPFEARLTSLQTRIDELRAINDSAVEAAQSCEQGEGSDFGDSLSRGVAEGACGGFSCGMSSMFGGEQERNECINVLNAADETFAQIRRVRNERLRANCAS